MTAKFVNHKLEPIKEKLKEQEIPYTTWEADDFEKEIRIEIEFLEKDKYIWLRDYFDMDLDSYTYLIIWE
jgi:hypothetical protein